MVNKIGKQGHEEAGDYCTASQHCFLLFFFLHAPTPVHILCPQMSLGITWMVFQRHDCYNLSSILIQLSGIDASFGHLLSKR